MDIPAVARGCVQNMSKLGYFRAIVVPFAFQLPGAFGAYHTSMFSWFFF